MELLGSSLHFDVRPGDESGIKSSLQFSDRTAHAIATLTLGYAASITFSGPSESLVPVLVAMARELHGLIIDLAPDGELDRLLRMVESAHDDLPAGVGVHE